MFVRRISFALLYGGGRWCARLYSTAVPCGRFHTTATARGPTADFVIFAMSLFTNHHNDTNRDKMAYCLTRETSRGNRRRTVSSSSSSAGQQVYHNIRIVMPTVEQRDYGRTRYSIGTRTTLYNIIL